MSCPCKSKGPLEGIETFAPTFAERAACECDDQDGAAGGAIGGGLVLVLVLVLILSQK